MDNARALTIAGIALGIAALLGLFLALTGGGGDGAVVVDLPEERASAPTAPSQTPERTRAAQPPFAEAPPVEDAAASPAPPAPAVEDDVRLADEAPTRTAPPLDASADAPVDLQRLPAPAPPAPAAPIAFCLPGVLPTPDGCADRESVLALAGEEIGVRGPGGGTQALTVALSDPAGAAEPRTARTCAQYLSLKANDWGPVTTADMRRDQRMNQFCGLIAMARRAAPGRGGLTALTEDLLESLPDDQWPSLGEADVANPLVLDTPGDPRAWFVQADRVEFTVRDVGHADFDEDGENEVLVFTALQAADGTAVGGGYALAEAAGSSLRLTPVDVY